MASQTNWKIEGNSKSQTGKGTNKISVQQKKSISCKPTDFGILQTWSVPTKKSCLCRIHHKSHVQKNRTRPRQTFILPQYATKYRYAQSSHWHMGCTGLFSTGNSVSLAVALSPTVGSFWSPDSYCYYGDTVVIKHSLACGQLHPEPSKQEVQGWHSNWPRFLFLHMLWL